MHGADGELRPLEGASQKFCCTEPRSAISAMGIWLRWLPRRAIVAALDVGVGTKNWSKLCWSASDGRMSVDWRESDGPVVAPLTHADLERDFYHEH